MGLFAKLAFLLGIKKKEVNVLVIGLNNSGKSTVVNHFKSDEDKTIEIVPTVGFSVEKFQSKSLLHSNFYREMFDDTKSISLRVFL